MACGQLCAWNFEGKACLRPIDEICPMTNIASQGKLQTNADRIRAMSDEELAIFLEQTQEDVAFNNKSKYAFEWEKWLKQPAEDKPQDQKGVTCHNCKGTDEPERYQNKEYCPNCGARVDV